MGLPDPDLCADTGKAIAWPGAATSEQFEETVLARVRPNEDEKTANTWYRYGKLAGRINRLESMGVDAMVDVAL